MKLVGKTAAAITLLSVLFTASVFAQRASTQKRGLSSPNTALQIGNIDAVNLFSGALTLTLGLGPEYPIGNNFTFRFQAILNSSIWDFKSISCEPQGPYDLPFADNKYNAGHAWQMLPLGYLIFDDNRWKFRSSDGGEHGLYPRLHDTHPATVTSNVFYSTSSTYLRMRNFPSGSAQCKSTGSCILLDLPNGEIREYHPRTVQGEILYMPTRATDALGNWLAISYPANGSWVITDIHGRTHTVIFAGVPRDYERISEIRMAQFGGGQATYSFEYLATSFERQGFVTSLCSSETPTITLQALHRIVQPDGSFYEMQYYPTDNEGEVLSAAIRSLRLPTGGEMRWTYTEHIVSSQSMEEPGPPGPNPKPIQKAFGVATKEVALTVGGAATGTWVYTYHSDFGVNAPGEVSIACHRTTTITDPLGNDRVTYFTTSVGHRWSFALPFTRCAGGTYNATGPFLSSETFSGSRETGTLLRSTFVDYESNGILTGDGSKAEEHNERIIFQKTVYHDDGDVFKSTTFSDFDGLGNYRTQTHAGTLSAQDAKTVQVNYNPTRGTLIVDPDLQTSSGDFVMPDPTEPWVLRTFDQQTTTAAGATATTEFCFDAATGFLERTRVRAGPSRAAKDLLMVSEPLKVGGVSTGFVASEKLYGGDGQASMDGVYTSLCNMTLPAQPSYQADHTYAAGVLTTSDAVDPCDDGAILSLVDQDIDVNTGLVAASRDATGLETAFDYDANGRLITEMPEESAWTSYHYQLPTQTNTNLPPRVRVQSCPNGSASCSSTTALTWRRTDFDGLGRQIWERLRLPTTSGLQESSRATTYTAHGLKATESVWGNESLVTTFEDYDPFGRPGKITPPGQPAIEISYLGDHVVTRKTRVMTANNVLQNAYTTEIHDAQGRLNSVCENQATAWAGTCTGVSTGYLYDVGDRITRVCSNQTGATCGQIRRYVYGNRGFLVQERHPEVGIDTARGPTAEPETLIVDSDGFEEIELAADVGNDWIFYTRDARGNVLTKNVEGSTQFDLTYHYDAAGRPIRIDETNGGNLRPLKEFAYGHFNSGTDRRAGKLVQTKRHNWVDIINPLRANSGVLDAVITEAFKYEGRDGRVSARQTRFAFNGTTYAFDFSQTYDPLGNVDSLSYPHCRHSQGDCPTAAPTRTVTYTYNKGFLRTVPGYATEVSYQAGGMLHQIEHANGVTYTMEIDSATGLTRPHRISTTAGWNTGFYSYDGTGNITEIGTQSFRYDRLNRLVSGQARVGSATRTQSATYDVYGNITSLRTNGSNQNTATDTTSNRLGGSLADYDGAGNMIELDFGAERYEYEYDAVNMMKHLRSTGDLARIYLYNADDERIAQFECAAGVCDTRDTTETWTLRDLAGKVLRIYEHPQNEGWQWKTDYVHGDGRLLSTVDASGVSHVHADHLGTPRQITSSTGSQKALHSYYPFGSEATSTSQDGLELKFTGHERDANGAKGVLDYMHARYCSPVLGRFVSVDPARRSQVAGDPQTWNRYTYGRNNPIRFVDPDGEAVETGWDAFNVGLGVSSLLANVSSGNIRGALLDAAGLVADIGAAAVPGLPGGSATLIKGKRAAQLARNSKAGRAFEQRVIKAIGTRKNTQKFSEIATRVGTVPDIFDGKLGVTDIKNVKNLSNSKQLRSQFAAAETAGVPFNLIVSSRTKTVSGPLQKRIQDTGGKVFLFDEKLGTLVEVSFDGNKVRY